MPQYSAFTGAVSATTFAAAGVTGVKFVSSNAYPIISLKIDNTEQFPATPQAIPPGATFTKTLAAGTHSYTAQNGYWDGASRFSALQLQRHVHVTNGQLNHDQPVSRIPPWRNGHAIPQHHRHMERLGMRGGTGLHPVYLRFSANGTCTPHLPAEHPRRSRSPAAPT